jgi:hypothetical protein
MALVSPGRTISVTTVFESEGCFAVIVVIVCYKGRIYWGNHFIIPITFNPADNN